jgi:hypothetical protein
LLGREPVERHEHYDTDGVLTGVTVVRRDPEFTSQDVALLLASKWLDAEIGPHGIPLSEAMDPANQFAFEGFSEPRVDFAEKARRDRMDNYYKQFKDANRNGHVWGVKRRSV